MEEQMSRVWRRDQTLLLLGTEELGLPAQYREVWIRDYMG